jgi:hypothetical protein
MRCCVLALGFGLAPSVVDAQGASNGASDGHRYRSSGAVVPNATVTLVGLEAPTRERTVAPVKSNRQGSVVIESIAPGAVSITAEFQGFGVGLVRSVTLRLRTEKRTGTERPLQHQHQPHHRSGQNLVHRKSGSAVVKPKPLTTWRA